jgi:PhoH-like ATPase
VIKGVCERTKGYTNFLDKLSDIIEIAPLAYVRGRNFANAFVIVDESQNLSPSEIKTLITRVSEDSKIVLTGDTEQIDNPYLDKHSNGLSYVVSKFTGQDLFAHIELVKSERGRLAEMAAHLL